MNSLLKAVFDLLVASTAQNAAGGVHWGAAPTGTAFPYITLKPLPSSDFEENTGEEFTEQRRIRFQCFANDMETAGTIKSIAEVTLKDPIVLTVGYMLHVNKGMDDLSLEPERDASGQEVWQGIIDFEFLIQRNPGD